MYSKGFKTLLVLFVLVFVGVSFAQKGEITKHQALDIATGSAAVTARGAQPIPPTVLEVDVEKIVIYVGDSPFEKIMTVPTPTNVQPKPFVQSTGIGDIVAVNGKPAKGLWMLRATVVLATPNPGPTTGVSIADSERLALVDQSFEIMQTDYTPVGLIVAHGPGFGPEPPGAPLDQHLSNLAVIGGTGAYLGVRGQLGTTGLSPDKPAIRFASNAEISALRRVNGGGVLKFVIHLIPTMAPEVVYLDDYLPAIFHSSDQTLVTSANPATAGEVVSIMAKGLGPTKPGVNPGEPFPRSPLSVCNSPIEVLVNGSPATVIFAGGEPGRVDVYEVEFRLPGNVKSGRNTVQVRAGYVLGAPFEINVY
jgi:hypothetical protein